MTERPDPIEHAIAKDTPRGESTLSSGVLDLLAAIVEAADVPLPSIAEADERAYTQLLERRLTSLRVVLGSAISPEWAPTLDPAAEAAAIRERTAITPVTYTLWKNPDGGDRS